MKSYDDFLSDTESFRASISDELKQCVLSHRNDEQRQENLVLLSMDLASLYADRMLRLYHGWLSEQVD